MIGTVILEYTDLKRLCRPEGSKNAPTSATVQAWARKQGIPFKFDGNGGIWTTVDALNFALGVVPGQEPADQNILDLI